MVDFPEGYGFAPGGGAAVMQQEFQVGIGQFVAAKWEPGYNKRRNRSPYVFNTIGAVIKQNDRPNVRGIFTVAVGGPPIEGTLQQVVTAMCTLHRIKGSV